MNKRMTFTQFWKKFSEQMLTYDPRHNNYPGVSEFCQYTQQDKLCRSTSGSVSENSADDEVSSNDCLTLEVFKKAWALPRFCKTLEDCPERLVVRRKYQSSRASFMETGSTRNVD